MKIICVSCSNPISGKPKYTHRDGEKLPLCEKCWQAAIQVQEMLRPVSYAEAARERFERRHNG